MKRKKRDLRCRICGETCPCLIYGGPVAHAHAPGGLLEFPLCSTHQEEVLKVHIPIKWRDCGDVACGFCEAKAKLLGKRR
jgi:hypothetical protein